MEEIVFLHRVFDVGLKEERVHLRVDVLNSDLETIESASFRDLDFLHETHTQVLIDNAIGSGEKGENVGNEVTLVVAERFPVLLVAAKVDFLSCKEGKRGEEWVKNRKEWDELMSARRLDK